MGNILLYNRDGLCGIISSDKATDQQKIIEEMQKNNATAMSDEYGWRYNLAISENGEPYLNVVKEGKPRPEETKDVEAKEDQLQESKTSVYRAIEQDKLELYKSNPENIPDISGEHFVKLNEEKTNGVYSNREYDTNEQYLHFFLTKDEASSYGESLVKSLGKDICVIQCAFDKDLVEETTQNANYEIDNGMFVKSEVVTRQECAIPLSEYSPEENFVGVVEELKHSQICGHGSSFLDSVFK